MSAEGGVKHSEAWGFSEDGPASFNKSISFNDSSFFIVISGSREGTGGGVGSVTATTP